MSDERHPSKVNKNLTWSTIVTLLAVVIMFALGGWQLQRAEDKRNRLAQIDARQSESRMNLKDLLALGGDKNDIPFQVSGRLHPQRLFFIDNKIHQGRVGYQVVAPLQTNHGWLLVNFGWVAGDLNRQVLPDVVLPKDTVRLSGVASIPNLNPMVVETAQDEGRWPVRLQQLDLRQAERFLRHPVAEVVMLLDPGNPNGFVREWSPVVMPPEKHVGYAVQWFAMGIAALLVYWVAIRKLKRSEHE